MSRAVNARPWSRGCVVGLSLGKSTWVGGGVALIVSSVALGAPQGEKVVQGSAQFVRDGSLTKITAADKTIINYDSFNINRNETVRFIQPSATSKVLNRITSADPTKINGSLQANGIVYIVNPAGVYFGNGALVNVGGIYAAAGNLSNADFNRGLNNFTQVSGAVDNKGKLTVAPGGVGALIGKNVVNSGAITADKGVVAMVAGDEVVLSERGGVMSVRMNNTPQQTAPGATTPASNIGVKNTGRVQARGGTARIVAGDMYSLAVRNSGTVQASNIDIAAQGAGDVSISGKLDARNGAIGGKGGSISITGDRIAVVDAQIDASGRNGGGTVNIGGDFKGQGPTRQASMTIVQDSNIRADAIKRGDGGQVVVYATDHTAFSAKASARGGELSGNGGIVETSAKGTVNVSGAQVDASAESGKGGTWLMDPFNVEIVQIPSSTGGTFDGLDPNTFTPTSTAQVDVDDINNALNNGTSVEIITGGAGADAGNITLQTGTTIDKTMGGAASLTLRAANDVNINGTIQSSADTLSVNLLANNGAGGNVDPNTASGNVVFGVAGTVNTNGGTFTAQGIDLVLNPGATIATGAGNVQLLPSSDTSTVGVGAGSTGSFNVSANELGQITSTGEVLVGSLTGSGAVDINTVDVTAGGYSLRVSGGSIVTESITVANGESITLDANNGTIDDAVASTLTATDGVINLRADDVLFNGSVVLDAGAMGTVNLVPNSGRTIALSTATARDFNITQNEIDDITAGTIRVGNALSGDMTVGAMDATGQAGNVILTTGGAMIAENVASNVTAATSVTLEAENDIGSSGQRFAVDSPMATVTTNGTGSDVFLRTKAAGTNVAFTAADDADVLSDGDVDVAGTVGGNLTTSAAGNITSGGLSVTGDGSFTSTLANSDIMLFSTDVGGTTALNTTGTTGDATITSSSAVDLAASTVNGNLSVTSDVGITDAGPIAVSGDADFETRNATNADIILDAANTFGGTVMARNRNAADSAAGPGSIDIRDTDGDLDFAGGESTGDITLRANDVDVTGTVTADNVTLRPITAATTIAINDATGAFTISAADLANIDSAGTVTIGATNADAVNIGSLGAIDLSTESYSLSVLGGPMTFNNGITLADNTTLTLNSSGAIDGSNMATDVTIGGANGALRVLAGGNTNLDTNISVVAGAAMGQFTIDEASDLTVGTVGASSGISATGVDINTTGQLTVSQDITATGTGELLLVADDGDNGDVVVNANLSAGTGGINVQASNDIDFGPSVTLMSADDIGLTADNDMTNTGGDGTGGAITFGDNFAATATDAFTATADGDIDDSADMGGPMGVINAASVSLASNNGAIGSTTAIDTQTTMLTASGKNGVNIVNSGNLTATLNSDMGTVALDNTGTLTTGAAWAADSFDIASTGNFTVDHDITSDVGSIVIASDGILSVSAGDTLSSAGGAGDVLLNAVDLTLLGSINAGTNDVVIDRNDAAPGTIGVGMATGGLTISGDELSRITADDVSIGGSNTTAITVDGVLESNVTNFNTLILAATRDNAQITFNGTASTFKDLEARADDGITVDRNLSSTTGILLLDGDADNAADTFDQLNIADGLTLSSEPMGGTITLRATTGGVTADGALTVNSNANIVLGSSISSPSTLALNANGQIILETATAGQTLTINADDGLTLNANVNNTASAAILNADADGDGMGTLTLASGQTINTGNNNLTLTAADLDLDGSITSGTGTVAIRRANMGTIGLGSAMGDMQISADELSRITAATLRIGNNLTTGINAAGVTAASTDNIASGIELITDAIDISGEFNTSDADLTLTRANNGSIGVGTAMGDMQISGAELAQITTNELLIGGGQTTDINVGGVSSAQSMNIDAVRLEAAEEITFSGGASTFQALTALARDGITVNSNVTTVAGNLIMDANTDNDADTNDNLDVADGRTLSSGGVLTLDATSGGIDADGEIILNAKGDISINDSLAANGPITITADSDASGQGIVTFASGTTTISSGNPITIFGSNLVLNGSLNAGAGSVAIGRSNPGIITLGVGSQGMTISGTELSRITATGLTIGGSNARTIIVNGITAANSNNIVGATRLVAGADDGAVVFTGSASTFNALDVFADNAITVGVGLTTDTGGMTFDADLDNAADGIDAVRLGADIAAPTTQDIEFNSNVVLRQDVAVTANDITFNGTINSETGQRALGVNSNGNGITSFNAAVGAVRRLFGLTTNADGTTRLGGNITTTQSIRFDDAIRLTNDVRVRTTDGGNVFFNNTVDSQGNTNRDLIVVADPTTGPDDNTVPFISFARDVGGTFALGDLFLNYDPANMINGHANVPRVATIIARSRNSSQAIITDTAATFDFTLSGAFRMGQNEKLTSGGSLSITAASATLGDLSALRSIAVTAPSITLQRRAGARLNGPGNTFAIDQGLDIIAGTTLAFSSTPTATGTGGPISFATSSGSGDLNGNLGAFLFRAYGELLATEINSGSGTSLTTLDLRAEGPTNTNFADAIAGAIPRETRQNDVGQETAIGQAQMEDLKNLGIVPRNPTSQELLDFLVGRAIYNDIPGKSSARPDDYTTVVNRLPGERVTSLLNAYDSVFNTDLLDDAGNKVLNDNGVPKRVSRADEIKSTLLSSVRRYRSENPGVTGEVDALQFRAFVDNSSEDTASRDYLDQLDTFLDQLDSIGLTPRELQTSKNILLKDVRPAGMGSVSNFEAVIRSRPKVEAGPLSMR